jgi:indole-3-glycerol phosphate synthase
VGLIAEIKRRSPSKGAIAPGLSAADQAAAYAKGGAAAISVLTEPLQFGGALVDLDAALPAGVPLLRKDFIVDRLQLLEAVIHGASAALLISRAMPAERLAELHADGLALGLELLVEVHDEGEMAAAIAAGYPAVGVNNRDLQTLKIDIAVCARLVPTIPAGVIAVYESGIKTRADVDQAAALGADAVLVGSALSASGAAEQRVRDLTGVARRARRGG